MLKTGRNILFTYLPGERLAWFIARLNPAPHRIFLQVFNELWQVSTLFISLLFIFFPSVTLIALCSATALLKYKAMLVVWVATKTGLHQTLQHLCPRATEGSWSSTLEAFANLPLLQNTRAVLCKQLWHCICREENQPKVCLRQIFPNCSKGPKQCTCSICPPQHNYKT